MPTPVEIALNLTKTGDGATEAAKELNLANEAAQTLVDKAVEAERIQQRWNQSLESLSTAGLEKVEAQLTAVIAETEKAGGSTVALQAKLGDVQQKLVSTADAARNTAASYRELDKGAGAANTGSANLASTLVRQLAPAAAALKLKSLAMEALSYAEGIKDAGERTGITTEEVQRLTYAANQNATSWSELEAGLKNLAVASQTNADKLAALGIATTDSAGQTRPLRDILGDLSEVIAQTEDPTKRTAIAVEFLGRSGQALIPLMSQGRAALKAFGDEAQRTGRVIDSETIKKLDESKQRLEDFNQTVTILSAKAVEKFMDYGEWIGSTWGNVFNKLDGLDWSSPADKATASQERVRTKAEEINAALDRQKQKAREALEAFNALQDTGNMSAIERANKRISEEADSKRTPEEKAAAARQARQAQFDREVYSVDRMPNRDAATSARGLLEKERDLDLAKIDADAKAERARLDAEAEKAKNARDAAAAKATAAAAEKTALETVGSQADSFQAGARKVAGDAKERGDTGLQAAAKALNDAALAAKTDGTTLEEARNLVAAAEALGKEMKARRQESAAMAALIKSATEALKGLRN